MSLLIGKQAPDFCANAVVNGKIVPNFTLSQFRGKNYVLLFFYPKDFTFVCPTEILAFQNSLKEFQARGAQVIGCSTDSEFSHVSWEKTPRADGGIEGVEYPIVSDINKTISFAYDILAGDFSVDADGHPHVNGELVAYRGLFLIDKAGIVQHQVVNNFAIGRSSDEELRTLDALIHFEQFGEVCPMNWKQGADAIKPDSKSTADYLAKHCRS